MRESDSKSKRIGELVFVDQTVIHVDLCVCECVCVCVCVCLHTCMCQCTRVCMHACVCVVCAYISLAGSKLP